MQITLAAPAVRSVLAALQARTCHHKYRVTAVGLDGVHRYLTSARTEDDAVDAAMAAVRDGAFEARVDFKRAMHAGRVVVATVGP